MSVVEIYITRNSILTECKTVFLMNFTDYQYKVFRQLSGQLFKIVRISQTNNINKEIITRKGPAFTFKRSAREEKQDNHSHGPAQYFFARRRNGSMKTIDS